MFRTCTLVILYAGIGLQLSAVSAVPQAVAADLKPITTSDLLRIRTVTDIDMTADGSRAVFAVRSIAEKPAAEQSADAPAQQEYVYRSHLFLLDLMRGSRPRQMTFGDRRDSSPRLSPDGSEVAFLRKGEGEKSAQVWIMPIDGGEARQITSFPEGAESIEWSPIERRLLVSSSVKAKELDGVPPWPLEAPNRTWADLEVPEDITPRPDGTRAEIRAWLAQNAKDENPRVINRLSFQDEKSLAGPMRFRHLFLVDVPRPDDASAAEPRRLTRGFFNHDDARFLPDGRRIVYTAAKSIDRHPDRVLTNAVYLLTLDDLREGAEQLGGDRMILSLENWRFRNPQPSGDGLYIAFAAQQRDEPTYRQWRLGIAEVPPAAAQSSADAEILWLTDEQTFDYSARRFQWMHGRDALVFTAVIEGAFPLLTLTPGLLEPVRTIADVGGLPAGVHSFATGGGSVLYAATTAANPCVLRLRSPRGQDGATDRLVMDLNEWVNERAISVPVEAWLDRPDGTRVQYWVMPPTNMSGERSEGATAGARPGSGEARRPQNPKPTYPLLLQIHGGPQAMWGPGEASMWHEFQLFCAWGYGIVYCNPRGSSGYGYEFQRGNYQNWGDGPAGDVLAAVDHALLHHEWADRDRLVVTGGSYAGYLTAWIVGHDHRFKAAAAQRGVYHLATFFGEGNAWRLVPWTMGGPPYDSRVRNVLDRESPFTYVNRIRTPLLLMHADQDLRTGVSQSEMMYRALKHLERSVEYIRYPGEGHDLSRAGDPRLRMDRLNRIIDFFERHIENSRAAPTHNSARQ